jgi:hypothetical protein
MGHTLTVKLASTLSLCACAILGAVVGAPAAHAADLYVDAAAEVGDGSKAKPLPTITEALAAAHEVENEAERIVIHVAAGTYRTKAAGGPRGYPR